METTFELYEESFDFWEYLNFNFSFTECQKIWKTDFEHYWNKWLTSDTNAVLFYRRLDPSNRKKVVDWFLEHKEYYYHL